MYKDVECDIKRRLNTLEANPETNGNLGVMKTGELLTDSGMIAIRACFSERQTGYNAAIGNHLESNVEKVQSYSLKQMKYV